MVKFEKLCILKIFVLQNIIVFDALQKFNLFPNIECYSLFTDLLIFYMFLKLYNNTFQNIRNVFDNKIIFLYHNF